MGIMLFLWTTIFGEECEIANKMNASQMILIEIYTYFDVERKITFLALQDKSVPKFRQQVNKVDVGFRLIRLLAPNYDVSQTSCAFDLSILNDQYPPFKLLISSHCGQITLPFFSFLMRKNIPSETLGNNLDFIMKILEVNYQMKKNEEEQLKKKQQQRKKHLHYNKFK